tara:strand:+ start:1171 stop:1452 length:282 start_codon:yes stop_codon:yes gene_type:complete
MDYYEYYLSLHQNSKCRRLHFIGQLVTIFFIVFVLLNKYWLLIPLIPFVIYPFAWSGHYFFEKNEPAAFHHPIKAKISDWRMFFDILKGKIKI